MKTRIPAMAASIVLILAIFACSLPGNQNQNNSNHKSNLAATITAQALIIQGSTDQASSNNPAGTKHPVIRTLHPENTATLSLSSTPGVPMVSVSSPTNCRTGPSTDYDLVDSLNVGQTAEVVGKYSGGNYWVIKTPSGGGNCWLWGQYATIIGNTDNLPEMIPPPVPPTAVPVVSVPAMPKSLGLSCSSVSTSHKVGQLYILSAEWTVNLTWKDNSDNEDGFYVYKDGSTVATLGANSTSYTDQFGVMTLLIQGSNDHTYGVAAYNSSGTSGAKTVDLTSCP